MSDITDIKPLEPIQRLVMLAERAKNSFIITHGRNPNVIIIGTNHLKVLTDEADKKTSGTRMQIDGDNRPVFCGMVVLPYGIGNEISAGLFIL